MSDSNSVVMKRNISPDVIDYAKENRDQGYFNDITINAETEFIPANRMILSCCSKFFEKMFKSEMKEKYETNVTIEAVDGKSMKLLLDFIYGGEICITDENVMNLLASADYLQMDEVLQFCFDFLQSMIDVDNCFGVLNVATLYGKDSLKKHVLGFIRKKYVEVTQTDDFKNLAKSDLITCISNLNRNQVKETVVCRSIMDWTKHDEETRRKDFVDLWQMVNLNKLPYEFLESMVFEKMISENLICSNMMNLRLLQLVKDRRILESETRIVSIGGWGTKTKIAEVYSFDKNVVSYPDFPVPIEAHRSLKMNNFIYCMGGYSVHSGIIDRVWKMRVAGGTSKWEEVASMHEKRQCFGATVFNDVLIVSAGRNHVGKGLSSSECYITQTNEWRFITPFAQPKYGSQVVGCDGYLYSIGGVIDGNYTPITERTDDLNGSWETVASLHTPRDLFCAISCEGDIYAIGGLTNNNTILKSVEKYDSDANEWMYVSDLNVERCRHAVCNLHGKIYVVGGIKGEGKVVKEVERYDPSNNTWDIVATTDSELLNHSVAVF